jgi:hypothetical protein
MEGQKTKSKNASEIGSDPAIENGLDPDPSDKNMICFSNETSYLIYKLLFTIAYNVKLVKKKANRCHF